MHASSGASSGASFERSSAARSSRRPRRRSQRRVCFSTRAATSAMSARVGAGPSRNTTAPASSAREKTPALPARAADVAKPARSECPAKAAASRPINEGGVEPGANGAHGADLGRRGEGDREDAPAAFLIGLVAAERDGDPLGRGEEQIGDVERDERGAAKPTGPAEEQQRPIAFAVERRRQRGDHAAQLGGEERRGLAGRGAQLAADPAAHGADAGRVAGRVEAGGLVRRGDRGEGEIDPGGLARRARAPVASPRRAHGERGEVRGERRRQRRQRCAVLGRAPGGEVRPFAGVGGARRGGRGGISEAARVLELGAELVERGGDGSEGEGRGGGVHGERVASCGRTQPERFSGGCACARPSLLQGSP